MVVAPAWLDGGACGWHHRSRRNAQLVRDVRSVLYAVTTAMLRRDARWGRDMAKQAEGPKFHLLGPLRVLHGGREVPVPAAKLRILLASMLLQANQMVSADELVAHLWGENPPTGAHTTLRSYVMRLRRVLRQSSDERSEPIRTLSGGYLVHADESQLDLLRFHSTLATAQRMGAEGDQGRRARCCARRWACGTGPPCRTYPPTPCTATSSRASPSAATAPWSSASTLIWHAGRTAR